MVNLKLLDTDAYFEINTGYYIFVDDLYFIDKTNKFKRFEDAIKENIIKESKFIEVNKLFSSIRELGKEIYKLNIYKSLSDIFDKAIPEKVQDLLKKWVLNNVLPYDPMTEKVNKEMKYNYINPFKKFICVCLITFLFSEIRYIINTFEKNYLDDTGNSIDKEEINKMNYEVSNYIVFSDIENIINYEYKNASNINYTDDLPYNFDKWLNDILIIDVYNPDCCEAILNLLTIYCELLCKSDFYNYYISTLKPTYISKTGTFINIETSHTILAPCMLKLKLILTSEDYSSPVRCKNPECQKIISGSKGRRYCDNPVCQSYRNSKKSSKWNKENKKEHV